MAADLHTKPVRHGSLPVSSTPTTAIYYQSLAYYLLCACDVLVAGRVSECSVVRSIRFVLYNFRDMVMQKVSNYTSSRLKMAKSGAIIIRDFITMSLS